MIVKNIRAAIETKIDALPGSRNKKQAIINLSAYAAGAAVGAAAIYWTYKAGKNFTTED